LWKIEGFEVSPVIAYSSMYPFTVPSFSIPRVMLSSQRLCPLAELLRRVH